MKKLTFLACALVLSLTACTGAVDKNPVSPESSPVMEQTETEEQATTKASAEAAPEKPDEERPRETNEETTEQEGEYVKVYYGNDTVDRMLTKEVHLAELTPESLTEALIDAGVLEADVRINALTTTEREGLTYLDADFNQAFLTKLNRMGTSGEYYYMGGVVNTFLHAYDAYRVNITAEGEPLESGHNIYDDYLGFYRPNTGGIDGTYRYYQSEDVISPFVKLNRDGSFEFNYSVYMSRQPGGSYEVTDDKVILTGSTNMDEVYVFDIQGENLVFNYMESLKIPLKDKAVFEPGY